MSNVRKGFTLIELLVVIAIIAILAAILFPVFAKVREKARQITCTSNMKEVGLGILQYVQDYDEKYPSGVYNATAKGNFGQGWVGEVMPYEKSSNIFKCPDDSTAPTSKLEDPSPVFNPSGIVDTDYPVSYAFNENLAGASDAISTAASSTVMAYEVSNAWAPNVSGVTDAISPVGVGDINTTMPVGSTVTLSGVNTAPYGSGTEQGYGTLETGSLGGVAGYSYDSEASASPTTGWHTGGANYLGSDGHVKFLRPGQVSPGTNAASATSNAVPATNTAAGTSATSTNPSYALTFSAI